MFSADETRQRWQGVVIPLVVIFREDQSPDLDATARHVQWIMGRGAGPDNTVFLVATGGGDFSAMTLQERKDVIRVTAEVVDGRAPLIAGAQSTNIRDTITICQFCEDAGVEAVQISGPYYYAGRPDDVLAWHQAVASETRVGFGLYNNWYNRGGYNMPLELVEQLIEIPNTVGIKWCAPDPAVFYAGMERFMPHVAMVDNSLQMPLKTHIMGCRAFVSLVPNFLPEYMWAFWELLEEGAYVEAQEKWDKVMLPFAALCGQIRRHTNGDGILMRAGIRAIGLPVGHSPLPSRDDAITPDILEGFRKLIQRAEDARLNCNIPANRDRSLLCGWSHSRLGYCQETGELALLLVVDGCSARRHHQHSSATPHRDGFVVQIDADHSVGALALCLIRHLLQSDRLGLAQFLLIRCRSAADDVANAPAKRSRKILAPRIASPLTSPI